MNSDYANWVKALGPHLAAAATRHPVYSAECRGEAELSQDEIEITGVDCYCVPLRTGREPTMARGEAEDTQLDTRRLHWR